MFLRRAVLVSILLSLVAAQVVRAAPPAPPAIALDGSTVVVTSITPRGRVFLYGFALEARGWYSQIVRRSVYLTDDGSGRVQWAIDRDIPLRSVWFAVDLSTGLFGVAQPSGYGAHGIELTDQHLKQDVGGDIAQLSMNGANVEFAVVRPDTGAWANMVLAQTALDDAKQPASVTVSVTNLQPIAGTTAEAPKKLKKGDVVFMMNLARATYGIGAVEK
jgi:hypothetical protein